MSQIIEELRRELIANSDEQLRESSQHFFKEAIRCYGIKSATVVNIGKEHFKAIKNLPKEDIFNLCNELWQSGIIEESFVACHWSYAVSKKYTSDDLIVFEKWIDTYINNWASCDTLCNHTVGELVEMYPESISELKRWATSTNRWMKRAAAVSLIIPARHGKFLKDIIEIADILLTDRDDMVQKGYGWMLKASSQAHEKEIFEYVMSKKAVMPRTAFRYAIEKMSPELKRKAMEK
ncbi:MAG TPA: DNA alkylation repair protein [Prolixibacteraceae bacterium]|nr:DNA alkylation repair protein [Prolixibacteraceae bacterium]